MAKEQLDFTGERFVPGIKDDKLKIEHYQRYLSVRELVKDKVVLDIACGEGYGSDMLASAAQRVIGIDIDRDVVEHAAKRYAHRNNLQYLQGTAESIPLEAASVDVVVSFETIEHMTEQSQYAFLDEIERVLKKDGVLIISTPNKAVYSDRYQYKNEFHVKEFYHDDFWNFLHEKFAYVQLFFQAFEVAGILNACEKRPEKMTDLSERGGYISDGKYYIAVASRVPFAAEAMSSVYMSPFGEYEALIQRIVTLQDEEEEKNRHIRLLNGQLEEREQDILALNRQTESDRSRIEELNRQTESDRNRIEELNRQAENDRSRIEELNRQTESDRNRIEELNHQAESDRNRIEELNRQTENDREHIAEMNRQAGNSRSRIAELECCIEDRGKTITENEKQIETLQRFVKEQEGQVEDLHRELRNKEGHIALLLEVERTYEHEKTTHAYKFSKKLQRIGNAVLPLDSRRRFFVRIVYNMIRHPVLMAHVVNRKRIRNYLKYIRLEGIQGVKRRYDEAVEIEKMKLYPADGLNIAADVSASESSADKEMSDYDPLEFPVYRQPKVSVIIPAFNQFEYTYHCLKAVRDNAGDVPYEVILADDCSTDITEQADRLIMNIRHIRPAENIGFVRNCNYAAQYAEGKYIAFLNNDTQVQENWLMPLVDLMERDERIGMTGSKLVYPDGFLQEAGGIVWQDASAWNYGNRKHPEDPEYNYVKEADYISGASIMIRRALWEEIGGFDERFAPAYCEDTDLAFEVRKHGYQVVYQPLSVVVHYEGVSNGTDIQCGLKAYQEVNQRKFYEKWKETLQKEHEPNGVNVFTAKDRSSRKKHILVVDHYVPHYDTDAGGRTAFMYLKLFVQMGFQVTFIGDNFYKHEPYTTDLNQMGIEVLYGNYYYHNWQEWLRENGHYFDYIYLQRPHIAIKYIDLAKTYSQAKILYYAHDLHHIREYREYELTKDAEKLASSEKWKKVEYELFDKVDVGHVVSSVEQNIMQKAFPDKPIRIIPVYIYDAIPDDINKDFASRHDLLYVGGFGHPPNVDAVLWFAKEVYPKILEKYPQMKWYVVGGKVPKEIQNLESENIIIKGYMPEEDLKALYRTCRMAVAPLRFGAGVKGKVVEAAYFQIPMITTSIGAEGLQIEGQPLLIADEAVEMAELICNLYEDYERLKKMSDDGVRFIRGHFTTAEAERVLGMDVAM